MISDGPRVPLLVISPYSRVNYIVHDQGDHASVVKFIDTLFNLPPLALLPDELLGRFLGEETYGVTGLGPEDALTLGITDLTDAFDPARLNGDADPLPAYYVEVSGNLTVEDHLNGEQYNRILWQGLMGSKPYIRQPRADSIFGPTVHSSSHATARTYSKCRFNQARSRWRELVVGSK